MGDLHPDFQLFLTVGAAAIGGAAILGFFYWWDFLRHKGDDADK